MAGASAGGMVWASGSRPELAAVALVAGAWVGTWPDVDQRWPFTTRQGCRRGGRRRTWLGRRIAHRTVTHWPELALVLTVVAVVVGQVYASRVHGYPVGGLVAVAVACGYWSHLILDAMTLSGIPLGPVFRRVFGRDRVWALPFGVRWRMQRTVTDRWGRRVREPGRWVRV